MNIVTSLLAALFPPRCEKIADLMPGRRALVRGTVIARDLIDSTLTAERCVYYQYTVEEMRSPHMAGLPSDGYWAMTRFDEAIVEFYLQDEDGDRMIIAPKRARIERGQAAPQPVDMGILNQRAHELTIQPGDQVAVQGVVSAVHDLYDDNRGYRAPAKTLMLGAPEDDFLSIRIIASNASESIEKSP